MQFLCDVRERYWLAFKLSLNQLENVNLKYFFDVWNKQALPIYFFPFARKSFSIFLLCFWLFWRGNVEPSWQPKSSFFPRNEANNPTANKIWDYKHDNHNKQRSHVESHYNLVTTSFTSRIKFLFEENHKNQFI